MFFSLENEHTSLGVCRLRHPQKGKLYNKKCLSFFSNPGFQDLLSFGRGYVFRKISEHTKHKKLCIALRLQLFEFSQPPPRWSGMECWPQPSKQLPSVRSFHVVLASCEILNLCRTEFEAGKDQKKSQRTIWEFENPTVNTSEILQTTWNWSKTIAKNGTQTGSPRLESIPQGPPVLQKTSLGDFEMGYYVFSNSFIGMLGYNIQHPCFVAWSLHQPGRRQFLAPGPPSWARIWFLDMLFLRLWRSCRFVAKTRSLI